MKAQKMVIEREMNEFHASFAQVPYVHISPRHIHSLFYVP